MTTARRGAAEGGDRRGSPGKLTVVPDPEVVVQRLLADRPMFHGGGMMDWRATTGTLKLLARSVAAGQRTLETGAGASTVVFAAAGARHTAISPFPDEHARIVEYCNATGVDASSVEFVARRSDIALPELADELDFAFIDGAHAFPHAVIDWHYVSRHLRVGGKLLLDDIPITAVALVYRHMRGQPEWRFLESADDRAALFERVAADPDGDYWRDQAFNSRYPDYSYAPLAGRPMLWTRHWLRRAREHARSPKT